MPAGVAAVVRTDARASDSRQCDRRPTEGTHRMSKAQAVEHPVAPRPVSLHASVQAPPRTVIRCVPLRLIRSQIGADHGPKSNRLAYNQMRTDK
jgi:hypothetical protein